MCHSTIGLSNFNRAQVAEVQATASKYQPTVLQNECHPYLQNKDLIDFCNRTGVLFQVSTASCAPSPPRSSTVR